MAEEQKIQTKVMKKLKEKGFYVVKIISATKKGVPDIIACKDGKFYGLEIKTPKTKNNVSPHQQHNLDKIKEAGGISEVIWDISQLDKL